MSPIHHHFELRRLAGDDGHHPLLADRRRSASPPRSALFIGDFTADRRRACCDRVARLRPRRRREAVAVRARPGARVDVVAADDRRRRRASGRWPPRSASSWSPRPTPARLAELVGEDATSSVPAPGVPETHPVFAAAAAAGRAGASARSSSPTLGAGAAGGAAADARRHRHRRQDDDHAADRRHAAPPPVSQRSTPATPTSPLVDGARPRRRRVRRRVHAASGWPGRDSSAADAAAWLNLAPDHLNWHAVDGRLRGGQGAHRGASSDPTTSPIGFADDPVVMGHLAAAPGRHLHVRRDRRRLPTSPAATLVGPSGAIAEVAAMTPASARTTSPTRSPHRRWCSRPGSPSRPTSPPRSATFAGAAAPHRARSARSTGSRWFNDSKATTPHAALDGDPRLRPLVLIAGGRNKGLDLSADGGRAASACEAVVAHRRGRRRHRRRRSTACGPVVDGRLDGRGRRAARRELAEPGDVVLLSPAAPASTGTRRRLPGARR